MDETPVERAKELRWAVLQAVRACFGDGYEGWLMQRSLCRIIQRVCPKATDREIHNAAVYCGAAGYMEMREQPHVKGTAPYIDWRITVQGVRLLDQVIPPDPGIEDDRA